MARRARALCTREEAKRLLPNYREPTNQPDRDKADGLIDDLIDSASQRIYEISGREFLAFNDPGEDDTNPNAPIVFPTPAAVTRSIDVVLNPSIPTQPEIGTRRTRILQVGDLASLTGLTYGTTWGGSSSFATVNVSADPPLVRTLPLVRPPWKPIRQLELLGDAWAGQVWRVTGVWGFPQVPADVREACAEQVAIWIGRDLAKFTSMFRDATGAGPGSEPRQLAQSVYDVAVSYNIPDF